MNSLNKKWVIDRKTWLRGEGSIHSYLLRNDDKKCCCLGQAALQCGYSTKDIKGVRSPANINWEDLTFNGENSPTCLAMMACNDNPRTSDRQKEKRLKSLAAKLGIKMIFKG